MSIKIVNYEQFIYILYEKTGKTDFQELKDYVEKLVHQPSLAKDIIIDVSRCAMLMSPEIGVVAKTLSFVEMNHRYLRLIANKVVTTTLDNLSLTRKKSLVIYANMAAFAEELKKAGSAGNKGLTTPNAKVTSTTISPEGSLSGENVKAMSAQVEAALKGNVSRVIIDLSKVDICDSVCIAQLMYLDGVAKNSNKILAITSNKNDILDLFKAMNLDKLFEIIPPPSLQQGS